jgi:hypothetical protein
MTEIGGKLHCMRCGHNWFARISGRPVQCPRCKSPAWDREPGAAETRAEYKPTSKEKPSIRRGGRQDIDWSKHPSFGIWADRTESDEELLDLMKSGWGKAQEDE